MPFIKVNGITISVADGKSRLRREPIGGAFSRADDGTARLTRKKLARNWDLETIPLAATEAYPLAGLLWGLGNLWTFNADEYSDGKAQGPAVAKVATLRTAESAPSHVAPGTWVANPKFGAGCFAVEEGRTNILSENVRTGTDSGGTTAGWTAIDAATLTSDATQFWQGAKSLKVVTNGAGGVRGGVKTDAVSAAASTAYAASVYLKASSGSPLVRVYLRDEVNGTSGTTRTATLSTTTWTRVEVTHTTGGGSPTLSLYVEEDTIDAALTFFGDGWQIEAGAFSTSWIAGSGATIARAAGSLVYQPQDLQKLTDLTIIAWTRGSPGTADDVDQILASVYPQNAWASGGPYISIFTEQATGSLLYQSNPASPSTVTKTTPWDGAWHQIAMTVRQKGGYRVAGFYDGALVAANTPASTPLFSTVDLGIGCVRASGTTSRFFNGLLDDVVVLPFAVPDAWISTWYTAGAYAAAPPDVQISGDIVSGAETVNCLGELDEEPFVQFSSAGAWQNSGMRLPFMLHESQP